VNYSDKKRRFVVQKVARKIFEQSTITATLANRTCGHTGHIRPTTKEQRATSSPQHTESAQAE
jgi:hypothetical protein